MRPALLALCLALSGCAGTFGMSGNPAQLQELVKNKEAACTQANGLYMGVTVKIMSVNVDKAVLPANRAGVVKIGQDCSMEVIQYGPDTKPLAPTIPGFVAPQGYAEMPAWGSSSLGGSAASEQGIQYLRGTAPGTPYQIKIQSGDKERVLNGAWR